MARVRLVASVVLIGAVSGWLLVLAWNADVQVYGRTWTTWGDLAAGAIFPLAALLARGPVRQRLWVALVGPAWLAGSVWTWAITLHQAALLVALVAFPSGRLRGWLPGCAVAGAVVIAFVQPTPYVVAACFATVLVAVLGADARSLVRLRGYAAAAALAAAIVLARANWLADSDLPPEPRVYQAAMMAVAVGFLVATHLARWRRAEYLDRAVDLEETGALVGLQNVLGALLHDPGLVLEQGPGAEGLPVLHQDEVVATIRSRSEMLTDPAVAVAVQDAVRLTVEHIRLRALDSDLLAELEGARTRLVRTVDRERSVLGSRLAERVVPGLRAAGDHLADQVAAPGTDQESVEILAGAIESLRSAQSEVEHILRGVPPMDLGGGLLLGALRAIAEDVPMRIDFELDPAFAGTPEIEAALFYICREAVANTVKHAQATVIHIQLGAYEGEPALVVSDDGCGGVNPRGSGVIGLGDRAAAVGARLSIASPVGAGTRVEVWTQVPGRVLA